MQGEEPRTPCRFIGESHAAQAVRRFIGRAARIDSSVLITGESGVGKELVALSIHEQSARHDRPFFPLNCAAVPESLFESELFGHEAGAYTGATGARRGAFELSQGGTLLLDEVGDLSMALQPKLLRVLESHELLRVGSERARQLDIRVISATNHDLKAMCDEGTFRYDLYYRLRVIELDIPPLRRRLEDVPELATHFLHEVARRYRLAEPQLTHGAIEHLRKMPWAGNARELQHAIERALVMTSGAVLHASCFETQTCSGAGLRGLFERDWKTARDSFEEAYVRCKLLRCDGNIRQAAREAGLAPGSFYRILRRLGVELPHGSED